MDTHRKKQQGHDGVNDCCGAASCRTAGGVLCVCIAVPYKTYRQAMAIVWATHEKKFYGKKHAAKQRFLL
jgi:hypothetical protein